MNDVEFWLYVLLGALTFFGFIFAVYRVVIRGFFNYRLVVNPDNKLEKFFFRKMNIHGSIYEASNAQLVYIPRTIHLCERRINNSTYLYLDEYSTYIPFEGNDQYYTTSGGGYIRHVEIVRLHPNVYVLAKKAEVPKVLKKTQSGSIEVDYVKYLDGLEKSFQTLKSNYAHNIERYTTQTFWEKFMLPISFAIFMMIVMVVFLYQISEFGKIANGFTSLASAINGQNKILTGETPVNINNETKKVGTIGGVPNIFDVATKPT